MDKAFIIDEILRTASNGKALGQRLFHKVTGIKETDWHGEYWARWGDALVEAGYSQNEWTAAHDELLLITSLLGLTRKLGRYPTKYEMSLERRSNPDFPSIGPIMRAGTKSEWVPKLLEYCGMHDGNEDIERILLVTSVPVRPAKPATEPDGSDVGGIVYLILAGGYHKIGFTSALYRRASQIANGHPNGAELIHSFETDDARGIEAYWHNRFAEKRVKGVNIASGEWFLLSRSDVAAFRKRKRFM